MTLSRPAAGLALAAATLGLSACGGGGDSDATIGGTINGLSSGLTVTLQNNGTDNFTIAGNGSSSFTFAFANRIAAGSTYSASVLTQPLGQTCVMTNASGTVNGAGDGIASIVVNCSTTSSVVGAVSGLNAGVGVTLTSNGTPLFLSNGSFAFPGVLVAGTTYLVSVAQQPAGQTCTVTNASGTVVANTSASVTVTCI